VILIGVLTGREKAGLLAWVGIGISMIARRAHRRRV
jgi:hypothetical protein